MNRTDRLFAITDALRRAGSYGRTAAWLAERFEVSTRTIKRDIAGLTAAGIPIASQDGRGGGYQLSAALTLPPLTFTPGEATAIALALGAEPRMPLALEGAAALQKVLGAMTPEQQGRARDLASRLWMRGVDTERPPCAAQLDEALSLGVVVRIDYVDGRGEESRGRAIEPMAFARIGGQWQVLAWCRLREAGRWFRMARIQKVWLTREPCPERALEDVFGAPPADAQPVVLPRA